MSSGPLVTISDAAKMGGIHRETIRKYIAAGYLETYMDGFMVYYRDVLRASRIADEKHKANSGKASKNYGKKKEA
jgi:DNA-binding transcriptional MerR regulator